jgi:tRNA pseudouridine65 synthase
VAVSRHPTSRYSLVEIHPETGRMHQIRRHFTKISHPIIGDRQHGDNRHNRFFETGLGVRRMLLAAVELSLPHPRTGESLRLVAPVDDPFQLIIDRMAWRQAVPVQWTPRAGDGRKER